MQIKKNKKKSSKKFKTSLVVLKRIIKTIRLMLVHLCLLYKNLNENFEVGIDDI